MKFIIDESIDFPIEEALTDRNHEVISIRKFFRGIDDEEIVLMANDSASLIVTSDKDFGELAFRQRMGHKGVVLIRLDGLSNDPKLKESLKIILAEDENLKDAFTVITPGIARIRKIID